MFQHANEGWVATLAPQENAVTFPSGRFIKHWFERKQNVGKLLRKELLNVVLREKNKKYAIYYLI